MSTEYIAFTLSGPTNKGHALEIWEHSSLLDIAICKNDEPHAVLGDLTPEQVVETALQILKIASYQLPMDDFRQAVSDAIQKDAYTLGGLCRDVGDVAQNGGPRSQTQRERRSHPTPEQAQRLLRGEL